MQLYLNLYVFNAFVLSKYSKYVAVCDTTAMHTSIQGVQFNFHTYIHMWLVNFIIICMLTLSNTLGQLMLIIH